MLDRSGISWQRRSQLSATSPAAQPHPRVLLVDRIGELGAWWGTAQIAFVGGSLGSRGGQNMLEPSGYGAAVSFGPNTRNFREIVAGLLAADAAQVVADGRELTEFVRRCLDDAAFARELGERARRVVLHHQGATGCTIELLEKLIPTDQLLASRRAA